MSTIRDVAKDANVSITTVSKILSNDPSFHVSDTTRKRVMQSVRKLDYKYAEKKSQIRIGCIMSLTYSYSDPYFSDILSGIQTYCANHNAFISLIVSYSQLRDSKNDLEKQLRELDGFIITELPKGKFEFITRLGKKIVFVDNYISGYCNVGFNNIYANMLIMEHLIDCGYRKIAYIGGPPGNPDFLSNPRMMIYREVLRRNNIPYESDLIYDCKWDNNLCSIQVRELLTRRPDTEVIFAGSDSLAITVLAQLKEFGLKCPNDIGVVGFNDIVLAKSFSPPLTTVRLPSIKMGELAAEMLIQQIKTNTTLNEQILLPVELKIRESTRKIGKSDSLS